MLRTCACEICGKRYDYGTDGDGDAIGYSCDVCSPFCDGRKYGRKETGWITTSVEDNITKLRLEQSRSDMLAAEMRAMAGRIETANQQVGDLLDTVKAMLVAAGCSEDERILQQQCDAAGTKPSDLIAATAGRYSSLIQDWEKSGRYGHCLPVIRSDDIFEWERIMRGEKQHD